MAKKSTDFSSKQAQLDELLGLLQNPDTGIDESIDVYKQAVKLIDELEEYLQESKNRITEITANDAKSNNK